MLHFGGQWRRTSSAKPWLTPPGFGRPVAGLRHGSDAKRDSRGTASTLGEVVGLSRDHRVDPQDVALARVENSKRYS
jgi:hypothetical protein